MLLPPVNRMDTFIIHRPQGIIHRKTSGRQKLRPAQKSILSFHGIIPKSQHDGIPDKDSIIKIGVHLCFRLLFFFRKLRLCIFAGFRSRQRFSGSHFHGLHLFRQRHILPHTFNKLRLPFPFQLHNSGLLFHRTFQRPSLCSVYCGQTTPHNKNNRR